MFCFVFVCFFFFNDTATTEIYTLSLHDALPTLTPALNVLSTTLPDSTFFRVVRTNAPPLPGLTCWNDTTVQSWPSRLSTRPFFRSLVLATSGSLLVRCSSYGVLHTRFFRRPRAPSWSG